MKIEKKKEMTKCSFSVREGGREGGCCVQVLVVLKGNGDPLLFGIFYSGRSLYNLSVFGLL